jgi:hypothetical protein
VRTRLKSLAKYPIVSEAVGHAGLGQAVGAAHLGEVRGRDQDEQIWASFLFLLFMFSFLFSILTFKLKFNYKFSLEL